MNTLRVLVIADDSLARGGLALLLANQPEIVIVGQVSTEPLQPDLLATYHPDLILWDLGWNPSAVLKLVSEVADIAGPIVALLPDSTYATEAWAAGPRGLLSRDSDASNLKAALIAVAQGLVAIDAELGAVLLPSGDAPPTISLGELTPREREVLQLLAEGLPNKVLAARLNISEHTIKFHVNSIMGKLGAQSRTEAVTRATRAGLIFL